MDYESKILLNRLVEKVDELNSPDWWVIGITVVNALIMAWLGWRQYKLQKQQNKITVYDKNKFLYSKIREIHKRAEHILMDINRTLYHYKYNEGYFYNKSNEILELLRWLQKTELDLSNIVDMTEKEYNSYCNLLSTLYSLLYEIDRGIRNKQINTPVTEYNFTTPTDDNFINSILDCCIDENTKNKVKELLFDAKNYKNSLGNKLLNKLQELCTL